MVFFLVLPWALLFLLVSIFYVLLLRPRRLRSRVERQGIKGPGPSPWYGNIPEMRSIIALSQEPPLGNSLEEAMVHSCPQAAFPHLVQWRNRYGPVFLYSMGTMHVLCITDPEMAREVALYTSQSLGKPRYLSNELRPLLGRGILSSNGPYWTHQKRIIAPEFYPDRVKGMVHLMAESTSAMLESWMIKIEAHQGKAEITVDEDLRALSGDIISRACFGRSYKEREAIFMKIRSLQEIMSRGSIGVPGLRNIPNKRNRELWRLESEIDSMILEAVKGHTDGDDRKDLLRLLLNAAAAERSGDDVPGDVGPDKFVVDNCKNIYFAGHETTATSASWCLMVLAAYPEWQARARQEVVGICGTNVPTSDMLRRMKLLTMVIQETLRLYPPVAFVVREALDDICLGGIDIPNGVHVQIPIAIMHYHQDMWGADADHFNPDRFGNGISGACRIPQAYMPFGVGARTCTGQHFAMAELKLILTLVLSKFSLSLSPAYRHSPVFKFLLQPRHGLCLVIEKL